MLNTAFGAIPGQFRANSGQKQRSTIFARKLSTAAVLPLRYVVAMQSAEMALPKTKSTGPDKVSGAFLLPVSDDEVSLIRQIKDAVSAIHADADVNPDRKA